MMRRILRRATAILTAVAVALCLAASAHGGQLGGSSATGFESHFSAYPAWTNARLDNLFLYAAESYWHAAPSCGPVSIVRVASIPPSDIPTVQAGSWAFVDATGLGSCTIDVVRSHMTHWWMQAHTPDACRVIAHEYGHLLGHWDVPQPGQMESHVVSPHVPDPACDRVTSTVYRTLG